MSYAIYGESSGYVHLVTGQTPAHVMDEFFADLDSVNVNISKVYNVYAVNGREEFKELEDAIELIIKEAQPKE